MRRSFFITGTDTGVGKTNIAAGIARALKKKGIDVGVMKPVETGCPVRHGRLIPSDALALKEASGADDHIDLINPYRFRSPIAPSAASRFSGVGGVRGVRIDLGKIRRAFKEICRRHDIVLVEGAGGLVTPVTAAKTMADIALSLSIPVLIVAAQKLGAVNQTLLTIHYARCRGIGVAGVVLNNIKRGKDLSSGTNAKEIERLSGAKVLAEIPFVKGGVFKAALFERVSSRLMRIRQVLPREKAVKEEVPSYIDY